MKTESQIRIAIIANVMPKYREGFYDRLLSRTDMSIRIYCQDQVVGERLKTVHERYPDHVRLLRHISFNKNELNWQFIPWKEIFDDYDVVFVEGNPRNISHAAIASLLKLRKHNVVLWSMAHSYRGRKSTEALRLWWSKMFDYLLVYTDAEADYLKRRGFRGKYILGMNNGLDQRKIDDAILIWSAEHLRSWRERNRVENGPILLSCARLDAKNRFDELARAMPTIIKKVPGAIWCLIGEGPEKPKLESIVRTSGIASQVRFIGPLYEEVEVAPWFLAADVFVHPAAIGLSMMHAFGYGLPVITHDNPIYHGPEYSAFEHGRTGLRYHDRDLGDLSAKIVSLLGDLEGRKMMGAYAQRIARERYNVDVMVQRFVRIAADAVGNIPRNG